MKKSFGLNFMIGNTASFTRQHVDFKHKRVTSFKKYQVAILLFIAILGVDMQGVAQTWGNRTGTSRDGYVINNDNSWHRANLRLQTGEGYAWIMVNDKDFYWGFAGNKNHDNRGYNNRKMILKYEGGLEIIDKDNGAFLDLIYQPGGNDTEAFKSRLWTDEDKELFIQNSEVINFTSFNSNNNNNAVNYYMTASNQGVAIGHFNNYTPGDKLDVRGVGRFGYNTTNYLRLGHDGSNSFISQHGTGNLIFKNENNNPLLRLTDQGVLGFYQLSSNSAAFQTGMDEGTFKIASMNNGGVGNFLSEDGTVFSMLATGEVGIGTVNPLTKLQVNGDISIGNPANNYTILNGNIQIQQDRIAAEGGLNPNAQLRLEDTNGVMIQSAVNNNRTATIEVQSDFIDLEAKTVQFSSPITGTRSKWEADGTQTMQNFDKEYVSFLDPVYITAPDVGLVVAGKIRAQDLDVTPNEAVVPDYVFLPDYKLRSIGEVATYIQANGHLPEVPSAKEIGENGYNVTSMDFTLLKKVEELTLYLIEANEKIEQLSKEVEALKKKSDL